MGSFGLTEYEPLKRVPQSHTTATAGRFSSRRNCSDNRGCLGTASASSCSDSRSCRDRFDQSRVLPPPYLESAVVGPRQDHCSVESARSFRRKVDIYRRGRRTSPHRNERDPPHIAFF